MLDNTKPYEGIMDALYRLKEHGYHLAIVSNKFDAAVKTAANAGIPCISVNWGFKSTEFLKENGAAQIVSTPTELVNAISDM